MGKHLDDAHKELKAERPKPAGRQLKQLALRLSHRQQRQEAQSNCSRLPTSCGPRASRSWPAIGRDSPPGANLPAGLRAVNAQNLQQCDMSLADQLANASGTPCLPMPDGTRSVPDTLAGMPGGAFPVPGNSGMPGDGGPPPVPGSGDMQGNLPATDGMRAMAPAAAMETVRRRSRSIGSSAAVGGTFAGRGTA